MIIPDLNGPLVPLHAFINKQVFIYSCRNQELIRTKFKNIIQPIKKSGQRNMIICFSHNTR
jgi:hypothetical protein